MLSSIGCLSKVLLCPLIWFAEEREEYEEQVDDINVDLQGAVDVFLGIQLVFPPAHHHLGVIHQELKNNDKTMYRCDEYDHDLCMYTPICENSYHVMMCWLGTTENHWTDLI